MLKNNLKCKKQRYNHTKNIEIGLDFLKNIDFSTLKDGKYEILGDEVYAIVQSYQTKPEEGAIRTGRLYRFGKYHLNPQQAAVS